jgi:hypothetical protein
MKSRSAFSHWRQACEIRRFRAGRSKASFPEFGTPQRSLHLFLTTDSLDQEDFTDFDFGKRSTQFFIVASPNFSSPFSEFIHCNDTN